MERLHQVRRRSARPRRPDLPDDAAGRTRRHPAQRRRRQGRRRCCAGSCWRGWPPCRPPMPNSTAPPPSSPRTKSCRPGATTASRAQRQGRARPRRRASRVRPQGLRSHDHPGHRVGGGNGHRHGVSPDRLEGRTAGLDHAVVRREGRGGMDERASLRCVTDREAGRAELGQHQRAGPIRRRVPDPARMDAPVAPGHPESRAGCSPNGSGR